MMSAGFALLRSSPATLATVLMALAGTAVGDSSLRYDISAGDHFIYERRVTISLLENETPLESYSEQIQIWGLESDGGQTLVLVDRMRVVDGRGGATVGGLVRVNRRGQRTFSDETLARVAEIDPALELMPILPPAFESLGAWIAPPDHFGRQWSCVRVDSSQRRGGVVQIDFVVEDPTGVSDAIGVTRRGSFWFDPAAGSLSRLETETLDSRTGRRIVVVARLHEKREMESTWRHRRLIESERHQRTLRLEDRLADQIVAAPDQADWIISRERRLWEEVAAGIPRAARSPFARLARSEQRRSRVRVESWRKRAEMSARWVGVAAPHWSLQTPDGETVRSESVRDGAVVEFFWRSDSPESLRSFPMLRGLREQAASEKYRVICLNVDGDASAGRRAIASCGSGLTHVLAGPSIVAATPSDVPIFRVLDHEGRVVAVYFGWQPALATKLATSP